MVSQKDFIVSSWRKKKFKNLFKNEIDIIIYKIEHKDYDVINLDKIFICLCAYSDFEQCAIGFFQQNKHQLNQFYTLKIAQKIGLTHEVHKYSPLSLTVINGLFGLTKILLDSLWIDTSKCDKTLKFCLKCNVPSDVIMNVLKVCPKDKALIKIYYENKSSINDNVSKDIFSYLFNNFKIMMFASLLSKDLMALSIQFNVGIAECEANHKHNHKELSNNPASHHVNHHVINSGSNNTSHHVNHHSNHHGNDDSSHTTHNSNPSSWFGNSSSANDDHRDSHHKHHTSDNSNSWFGNTSNSNDNHHHHYAFNDPGSNLWSTNTSSSCDNSSSGNSDNHHHHHG